MWREEKGRKREEEEEGQMKQEYIAIPVLIAGGRGTPVHRRATQLPHHSTLTRLRQLWTHRILIPVSLLHWGLFANWKLVVTELVVTGLYASMVSIKGTNYYLHCSRIEE